MTKHAPITRLLTALMLCCAMLVPMTGTAAATPAAPATAEHDATADKVKAKVNAKLLDTKVKVNADARIDGKLELPKNNARSLELIVVQRLVAGAWVDVSTGSCRPNYSFRLSVSFSIAATYTLRVYYPETATATAAASGTFNLTVLG
ncbi:hypothetical protein [Actinokineospora xionganensis]|uniref:Secreted protein n=1 Tax=Actinokineospora xionganensis TaxID=2684470 RepID=A0ABR7L5N2_9PSEU|nr:hypothetical protein [Actinokineospora xionganensis]MBC6447990.1 hypothetical protein [Actinokineospora xionganensis]